jgi:hypothetical protein
MATVSGTIKNMVFATVLALAGASIISCKNPFGAKEEDPEAARAAQYKRKVDSLLIKKDTIIRPFTDQFFYVDVPTAVSFSIDDYLLFNSDYFANVSFALNFTRMLQPNPVEPGEVPCFYYYNWNPVSSGKEAVVRSFTKGYYRCYGGFYAGTIDMKISFKVIDAARPDSESNNSFIEATKAALDRTYTGYLNIFQTLDEKNKFAFLGIRDSVDCYKFDSDSGMYFPLVVTGKDWTGKRPVIDIIVADRHGMVTDALKSSGPGDELVIKATSSTTYLKISADLEGAEYSFKILSAPPTAKMKR